MDRTRRLLAATALLAVVTAACSSGAKPTWTWAPDTSPAAKAASVTTPSATPDAEAAAATTVLKVSAFDLGFSPASLSVPAAGRYQVEGVLGRGTMGVVYRCRHLVLDRSVAIKILKPDLAQEEEVLQRFMIEAKAASSIGNKHIVNVLDFGRLADGSSYLVMEQLNGQTLGDLLAASPLLPAEIVLSIALQIAGAPVELTVTGDPAEGLSAVIADATGNVDAYRFRFLEIDPPAADGSVIVDFNRAYLPPCAFSEHYICPLPPADNRLAVRVEAGERIAEVA